MHIKLLPDTAFHLFVDFVHSPYSDREFNNHVEPLAPQSNWKELASHNAPFEGGVGLLPISFGGDIAFVKAARGDGISRQRTDSAGVFFRAARRHGKYVP